MATFYLESVAIYSDEEANGWYKRIVLEHEGERIGVLFRQDTREDVRSDRGTIISGMYTNDPDGSLVDALTEQLVPLFDIDEEEPFLEALGNLAEMLEDADPYDLIKYMNCLFDYASLKDLDEVKDILWRREEANVE